MTNIHRAVIAGLLSLGLSGCAVFSGDDRPVVTAAVTGDYLGQDLPGLQAQLFAPGIVATGMNDRDITISPSGDEIFFAVMEQPHYSLVCMRRVDGCWTGPEVAPFSGHYDDYEPQFSPDGNRLYFCSVRPLDGVGEPKDSDIWYVIRTDQGWAEPVNLGSPINTEKDEFYPSVTHDGTLYFTSADMKLYRSRREGDGYAEPEKLPDTVNSKSAEYNAFIAPDESYLIFTSHGWRQVGGRGDLFVCFRDSDDNWSEAVCLGTGVNSDAVEMSPTVSPDGRYLFFGSLRKSPGFSRELTESYAQLMKNSTLPGNGKMDIYWVDASVIQECR